MGRFTVRQDRVTRNLNLCSKSLRRLVGASIWRRKKIAGKVWHLDVALIPWRSLLDLCSSLHVRCLTPLRRERAPGG
jgi:hypothetical protein